MKYPNSINDLIDCFMAYPGVGRKTAERYALFTVNRLDEDRTNNFSKALTRVKQEIVKCSVCGQLTDQKVCDICSNEYRDKTKIIVVEQAKDVISIEKSKNYNGLYHVLHGAISPLNGIGVKDINLSSLLERLKDETVKEVILATNANFEGETTALYIKSLLENIDILVTRIAYGIPVGGNLDYADELTLNKAIEGRTKI